MTDRERLSELLEDTLHEWECDVSVRTLTEISEHLIENGVIVPPCKVGDTMYCDGKFFADHCKGQIMSFPVDIVRTEVCSTLRGEIDMVFGFKRFGKDVFLTREEAEKALKEECESNV